MLCDWSDCSTHMSSAWRLFSMKALDVHTKSVLGGSRGGFIVLLPDTTLLSCVPRQAQTSSRTRDQGGGGKSVDDKRRSSS